MTDDQTTDSMPYLRQIHRLLADGGVRFTNSFVSYPLCCPSRVTYLTGQYAHNHHVLFNGPPTGGYAAFKHPETALPVALQRAGYYTVHVGKYLNGYGWTKSSLVVPPGWNDFRGAIGPWTYNYYGVRLFENGRVNAYSTRERDYESRILTRIAVRVIHQRARSRGPYFLNLAFLAPHSASETDHTLRWEPSRVPTDPTELDSRLAVPPLEYRHRFDHLPLPRPPAFDEADVSRKPSFIRALPRLTVRDIRDITARYQYRLGSLLAIDDAVGAIVAALRETGQLNRTVLIFTSDNGFFNGEHRIVTGKYYVYEPSVRVPLIIEGPGMPRGVTQPTYVANVDLAPTILQLARARPLRPIDGISLVPLLKHPHLRWRRDILLESGANSQGLPVYAAVRTPSFLYAQYSTGDRELYDMRKDDAQLHNLYGERGYSSEVTALRTELDRLQHCAGADCHPGLP
jgi:arylsulfatase A-like enzyme